MIIRHIGHAIQDLHKHGIYHLDVKPENIIYESNDPQVIQGMIAKKSVNHHLSLQ